MSGESRGVGNSGPDSGLDLTRASPDAQSPDSSLELIGGLLVN